MKTIFRITTSLLFLTVFSLTSLAQFNGELKEVTIPAPSLSNNMFNEPSSLDVKIYLPPSYNEVDYAFPVLYFLFGWGCGDGNSADVLISDYDARLSQENMKEMIVVFIAACNTLRGPWYVNSAATGNWEDLLRYDVINYVDSRYRTIRKNQCRGIAGHSMGGFGAFNLAIKYPDIFNSFYVGSPSLCLNSDLDEYFVFNNDAFIKNCIDYLESIKSDDPASELVNLNSTFLNQSIDLQLDLSIGAAFAPDPDGHVPFIKFPYSMDENRQLIRNDSIMNIWHSSLGQWDQKMEPYFENLSSYDTLIFNYGDEEDILGRGVRNVYNIIKQHNIESSIIMHDGGHTDSDRFYQQMFPAMSKTLWRDSSRFRSGTDILAFELDNQIQETIIDSERGTVEAFVSDTTDIEAIIPHMILSDGAWETPIASQELDFSWGPISFRVTSGDGQSQKLWDVTVTQISTSSIDVDELEDLYVFPNPASNILYINNSMPLDGLEIQIYNITGASVLPRQKLSCNKIDIGNLAKGIFFLRISGRNINYVGKFIKE